MTLYDRLLGTYTPAGRAKDVVYGLDGVDPRAAGSFAGLLSMPFQSDESGSIPDRKVRIDASIGR